MSYRESLRFIDCYSLLNSVSLQKAIQRNISLEK